jgi:TonB dependent receptor/Carboxypeptidase regulatory-like domain/TonB-dependent Receptor Plug Domain
MTWKSILSFLVVLHLSTTMLLAQASLQGIVTAKDDKNKTEPVIGAVVKAFKGGTQKGAAATDAEGFYFIANLDAGTYEVQISSIGYKSQRVTGIQLVKNVENRVNAVLFEDATVLEEFVVVEHNGLMRTDEITQGGVISQETIQKIAVRSVSGIASTVAGISADENGNIFARGERPESSVTFLDGIRIRGKTPQLTQLEQVQVITGGVEAQYGDVRGAVISLTSKGPSEKYSGGAEVESSQLLDPYGYNRANLHFSGPILKKDGESIIGFRVSGDYLYRKDDNPASTGIYQVKPDVLAELEKNPVTRIGSGKVPSAQFLTQKDVELLKYRPNQQNHRLDADARIEARISKAIDVALSGGLTMEKNRFMPNASFTIGSLTTQGNVPNTNFLLNSNQNPIENSGTYRGNFRFRHRLSEENNTGVIQNASYTLQAAYENDFTRREDYRHSSKLFDYGYVGVFDFQWKPSFDQRTGRHSDYTRSFTGFAPGTINPILAAYNNGIDIGNIRDISVYNGSIGVRGDDPLASVWSLHNNIGLVSNQFLKQDRETFTIAANSSLNIVPGSSAQNRHSIQFGIMYEQRTLRQHSISPRGLWDVARDRSNRFINGLNTAKIVSVLNGRDTIYAPLVDKDISNDFQFYKNIRTATGKKLDEYVNIDGLKPDQLKLSMFSARDLINDFGLIDYYGYDYLGEKRTTNVSFNDFFTATDANGARTFPVAAFRPIYAAGYIQDKFQYKDIIVSAGLRVDRYDANSKVLKDPYSLYEVQGAKDFHDKFKSTKPTTIGDAYKVYVQGDQSSKAVQAYRDGDNWYLPNGTPVNSANVIFGSSTVTPKLVTPNARIEDKGFDPTGSFKDYDPTLNWMPRIGFSFPISDQANFFAHYDVLIQRPSGNDLVTALDYFQFYDPTTLPRNNANLRPEKTIDYEVGFQQRLTELSALKVSSYYREMRDMIQRRTYLYIPVISSYDTYDNQDFGTTKGFSMQYDLRKGKGSNLSMLANYTLQFAEGTGSDANSQRGITSRGNLRTLFPLSFDETHSFKMNFDYRYGYGAKYNGPKWFGKDILSDFGVNLQTSLISGRPYTRKSFATPLAGEGTIGSINGARKPWTFVINLTVDKDFVLTKPEAKRPMSVNVAFRAQNLLDTRNLNQVYSVSGSAEDDAYLTSPNGQAQVQNAVTSGFEAAAFLNSYQWRLLNPAMFTFPRRMFVMATFQF